jgi:hypothetical protein
MQELTYTEYSRAGQCNAKVVRSNGKFVYYEYVATNSDEANITYVRAGDGFMRYVTTKTPMHIDLAFANFSQEIVACPDLSKVVNTRMYDTLVSAGTYNYSLMQDCAITNLYAWKSIPITPYSRAKIIASMGGYMYSASCQKNLLRG